MPLSLFTPAEACRVNAIEAYQNSPVKIEPTTALDTHAGLARLPPMVTLSIDGGRKNKVRPGDILGALTGEGGIPGHAVGKIDVFDFLAYVAIEHSMAGQALSRLAEGSIKGRRFKVRKLR